VDFANHDDDVAFSVSLGDGIFTELHEVRWYSPQIEATSPARKFMRLTGLGWTTRSACSPSVS
ncbi:unnamed protein product, partial [Ascophyllum nodosum]